ncbi:hypothetical protein BJ508DRAFT_418236 [Ascobolus immersus RN42]|uniref:Uncharacterized protein n=1 Tax=Ascobolus immersus RN42 TaxID=1160509 RepID=A0A3N4HN61_ASCIM|nr:hypothetical protein BJ508DRAFT_418236 [Ascobolus immersus RN42]
MRDIHLASLKYLTLFYDDMMICDGGDGGDTDYDGDFASSLHITCLHGWASSLPRHRTSDGCTTWRRAYYASNLAP